MTTYPDAFDSDLELPRATDDVTELSSDIVNSLRDATIAIQKVVGLNPQGQKASLSDRISVSIDTNGYIKKSALENIGLVTLPIANKHIGASAGILESKLSLDYATAYLKGRLDSLRTDFVGLQSGLALNTDAINTHFLGIGNYHDGYHIKINAGTQIGVAGLSSTTVGAAINELSAYLLSGDDTIEPHIDLNMPSSIKHVAGVISVDASNFVTIDRTVTNVQDALDKIDASSGVFGKSHLDTFHSNGILKEINSGTYYNPNQLLLDSTVGVSYDEGRSVVKIPEVVSFSSLNVKPGDILVVHEKTGIMDVGSYQIRAVGPMDTSIGLGDLPALDANELTVFHTFVESRANEDGVSVSIYKPASALSEYAPLACAIRNNETIVDTISVLNPNAARIVSVGFNGSILNSDGYEIHIKAGIGNGVWRELLIPNLSLERLATNQAEPVTAKTVAERINAYVSDPNLGFHFPITAFRIGNELAIAHNLVGPDYFIRIEDGYTGNFALGLDAYGANILGTNVYGAEGNSFVVNGSAIESIKTLFDGYVSITEDSDTFVLWSNDGQMINPLRYGINAGSVMHVTGHPSHHMNGSYTLMAANAATVSVFSSEPITAPVSPITTFDVFFSGSDVSLSILESAETDRGIVQIYIDSSGQTSLYQRLKYDNNIGSGIKIADISTAFPAGEFAIVIGFDGNDITFNILDDTVYGETVTIHKNFLGSFKLYHSNGLDYLVIHTIPGTIPGGIEIVTVNDPLPIDEALHLCSAHFDGTLSVTGLMDTRLFGNLGARQVRDDFVEIFSQRPVQDLRSDGVVRGFDVLNAIFYDSVSNMQAIPLRGGVAYVSGVRVAVETQKVTIQAYDAEGNIISNARRIVGINEFGTIQVISDELGEVLVDGYNASAEHGKILPLYCITIVDGGLDDIIDIRRFINNIDDKIEIIVDETNNVVGNFRSLEGALLFASKYPGREKLTIRIINSVFLESPVVVPDGVSIIGGAPYGGDSKHQIVNYDVMSEHYLITLSGNNRLENVEIISPSVSLGGALVYINGSNVNIEHCLFRFGEDITTNSGDLAIMFGRDATHNIRIVDNKVDNVYSGIVGEYGTSDLFIVRNVITNVSGTGGNSYGIRVGSGARDTKNVVIEGNSIRVPSIISGTDLRGISVESGFDIDIVRILNNDVIHEAQNTMTNGIRVDVMDGYSGVVDQLFVQGNTINGIKLDDNYVFGIYVANVNNAIIKDNILMNIGVDDDNRSDTAMIRIASTFGFAEIVDNILQDSNVLRGVEIETQTQNCRVNISRNKIMNIGKNAHYIRGGTASSIISENMLVGPGKIGIRWNGVNTKISGNSLSRPNTLAIDDTSDDYAFEEYAIYTPSSDIDIVSNTITGMIFDFGSKGISNAGAGRDRLKILDNTISGSLMDRIIELFGSDHVINNNKLSNEAVPAGESTLGIELNSVTNSLIMGNMFRGSMSSAITSSATDVANLTIVNNAAILELLTSGSIRLNGDADNCLIVGNRFPDGSVEDNVIGTNPTYGVYNNSVIGINVGLKDTRGLHASSGVTSYDSVGAANFGEYPHWVFNDSNSYWEANSLSSAETRMLYFPIEGLPNGAKLDSVQVQGRFVSGGVNFTAQLFRRSVKVAGMLTTAISSAKDMSSASSDFGNTLTIGLVNVTTSGGEIINYKESNYYLQISHQDPNPTDPDKIRIYGVTINFTY